jgi:hypothetical protein
MCTSISRSGISLPAVPCQEHTCKGFDFPHKLLHYVYDAARSRPQIYLHEIVSVDEDSVMLRPQWFHGTHQLMQLFIAFAFEMPYQLFSRQ